jgi:hypothetical protein
LKVFIQLACKEESPTIKNAYGQVLLNAKIKSKQVKINVPEKRVQSQSIGTNIEYCTPISASIDVLFNSLVRPNTFI